MTGLLLDTHTFLWFLWDDPKLSNRAKEAIENVNTQKFVSIASCWEIAIKVGMKKLDLGESSTTFLPRELERNNFELLSISLRHATLVESLETHHKDPFDRLLVAQTRADQLTLVSADGIFEKYTLGMLW